MMGTKIRSFSPLPDELSLEDLVPEGNFYRRLQAQLDLSFVRDLVGPLYAKGGRPSVDPVVFFKSPLFEVVPGLRPLRAFARPLQSNPHPRTIRPFDFPSILLEDRRGVLHAGLVWSEELFFDAVEP